MSRIRGKNTKPELRVRGIFHRMGLRYRLHARELPGRPDLVLPRRRAAVFVHGCYWHRHPGCKFATTPDSNRAFWADKLERNVARDSRDRQILRARGWDVIVIWECAGDADIERVGTALLATLAREEATAYGVARTEFFARVSSPETKEQGRPS